MKKLLPIAVASALAGVNGAQAVNVNSDGLGQTLLYPFYTVEGGQNTLINLVNTTSSFKAVKVRILESMNSDEVLDFNLYLSPFDHWSAAIRASASGEGAEILTNDRSCTVPNSLGNGAVIPFRNFEYAFDAIAPQNSLSRTREGYVEIIEMGDIDVSDDTVIGAGNPPPEMGSSLLVAILHGAAGVPGVPGNCPFLELSWSTPGLWNTDPSFALLPPSGGLYGYGVLIDVAEGTDATYDAIALDNFTGADLHTPPGSTLPSLGSGTAMYDVLNGVTVVSATAASGIDAVSATLMVSGIANDFVLEQAIAAGTDWVITFPTKKPYVNTFLSAAGAFEQVNPVVFAPFTAHWFGGPVPALAPPTYFVRPACEAIAFDVYDREERTEAPSPLDFSPPPPGQAAFALCAEANVLTFNSSNVLKGSSRSTANLAVNFESGWMNIDLTASVFGGAAPPVYTAPLFPGPLSLASARELDAGGPVFSGLPTVGFAVQKYVNGNLGGLLSNYAGSVTHKGVRSISSTAP